MKLTIMFSFFLLFDKLGKKINKRTKTHYQINISLKCTIQFFNSITCVLRYLCEDEYYKVCYKIFILVVTWGIVQQNCVWNGIDSHCSF